MPNYQHKVLLEKISNLSQAPQSPAAYKKWIAANDQLEFLDSNAQSDELILYAVGDHFFVHGVAIKKEVLLPLNKSDLLGWQGHPFVSRAGYGSELNGSKVWVDKGSFGHGSKTMEKAQQLVFMRTFDGLNESPTYCEILQEFTHVSEIHWRNEFSSYCSFDENGDFDQIVSVTIKNDSDGVALVSVQREALELYLAASNSILVHMFDFTCTQRSTFDSWSNVPERLFMENDKLFYRQKIDSDKAGYTRGIQIVPLSRSKSDIFSAYHDKWSGKQEEGYVEFKAYDWRNGQETRISTDPAATTNYFVSDENSLPYETSPAFFRPEVLSKYKSDQDKYSYDEVHRTISCRHQWTLRSVDINEAGQVHAYIYDLRTLPHKEQLHWLSFNEPMIVGISKRSFEIDFEGSWDSDTYPLQDIRPILEKWVLNRSPWWKLRRQNLLYQTTTPRIESRDDWGRSFSSLSQLIIEGLVPKAIRGELDKENTSYKQEGSITLLEKLLVAKSLIMPDEKLHGLKSVNYFRNKASAHAKGSQFDKLSKEVVQSHGSYSDHFLSVCKVVANELLLIEKAFGSQ